MTFIQLCTQSTHPLVRKALERGGWEQDGQSAWRFSKADEAYDGVYYTYPDDAEPYHEAAVAWKMGAILIAHHPHRLDAIAIVVRAIMNETDAKEQLAKAVEALEVE